MIGSFRRRALCFGMLLCIVGADAVSAAATPLDPPDGYSWSDCIYEPSLADSTVVDTFWTPYEIQLNCKGVRHIKEGHGFNPATETCIESVLAVGKKRTSISNSNNWQFKASATPNESGVQFDAYVVVGKYSDKVITAYVDSGTWEDCASFPLYGA